MELVQILARLRKILNRFGPKDLTKQNGVRKLGCWPGQSSDAALATLCNKALLKCCALHSKSAETKFCLAVQTMKAYTIAEYTVLYVDGKGMNGPKIPAARPGQHSHQLQHQCE